MGGIKGRMRLYLVRHGQTSWNIAEKAQGHTDIDLDDTGLAQAKAVGCAFEGIRLTKVISSDLIRASHTAETIATATGAALITRADLRERSFGVLEGHNYRQVRDWYHQEAVRLGISFVDVKPEGGESVREMWARLGQFRQELQTMNEDVAAVMHGGSTGLLLAQLILGGLETGHSFRLDNCGITELERRPDGFWRINRLNDCRHLAGIAITGNGHIESKEESNARTQATG